jgi:hypothetical protein
VNQNVNTPVDERLEIKGGNVCRRKKVKSERLESMCILCASLQKPEQNFIRNGGDIEKRKFRQPWAKE